MGISWFTYFEQNTYLFLTDFEVQNVTYEILFFPSNYGQRASRLSTKSMREKTRSVAYSTALELG